MAYPSLVKSAHFPANAVRVAIDQCQLQSQMQMHFVVYLPFNIINIMIKAGICRGHLECSQASCAATACRASFCRMMMLTAYLAPIHTYTTVYIQYICICMCVVSMGGVWVCAWHSFTKEAPCTCKWSSCGLQNEVQTSQLFLPLTAKTGLPTGPGIILSRISWLQVQYYNNIWCCEQINFLFIQLYAKKWINYFWFRPKMKLICNSYLKGVEA